MNRWVGSIRLIVVGEAAMQIFIFLLAAIGV